MGDYTKLIVHADARVDETELRAKVDELRLDDSAYHCGGVVVDIKRSTWRHAQMDGELHTLHVVLVGQTKWGGRQSEFLKWFEPFVVGGSGEHEIWAFQIWEYGQPKVWALNVETAAAT